MHHHHERRPADPQGPIHHRSGRWAKIAGAVRFGPGPSRSAAIADRGRRRAADRPPPPAPPVKACPQAGANTATGPNPRAVGGLVTAADSCSVWPARPTPAMPTKWRRSECVSRRGPMMGSRARSAGRGKFACGYGGGYHGLLLGLRDCRPLPAHDVLPVIVCDPAGRTRR